MLCIYVANLQKKDKEENRQMYYQPDLFEESCKYQSEECNNVLEPTMFFPWA